MAIISPPCHYTTPTTGRLNTLNAGQLNTLNALQAHTLNAGQLNTLNAHRLTGSHAERWTARRTTTPTVPLHNTLQAERWTATRPTTPYTLNAGQLNTLNAHRPTTGQLDALQRHKHAERSQAHHCNPNATRSQAATVPLHNAIHALQRYTHCNALQAHHWTAKRPTRSPQATLHALQRPTRTATPYTHCNALHALQRHTRTATPYTHCNAPPCHYSTP